jgi:hypothetical protein
VHKLPVALLLAASAASAQQRLGPDPAFAKLPGPALRIRDSLQLDLKANKIEPPLTMFPGPKGSLVVYSAWRAVTAFDSLGRRQWSKGSDRRERDIGEVTAVGWDAEGMWVSDAAIEQVAQLDPYGNVTKSIEMPSWVRPTFSNRKAFPVFESMRVFARYPDGTMLVMPRGAVSITGATGYDQNANYLLRINEDGIIQSTLVKFPSPTIRRKEADGKEFAFQNPVNQSFFRVSPDGMRTVLVSVDTASPKVDTVVIRALGEKGDTLWTQKLAYPAWTLTDAQLDSIARTRWGNDTEYRERRAKYAPHRGPAFTEFVMDADKSVWITLRGNGSTRPAVGFDQAGKPIGKILLPNRRVVRAANLGALWIGEARADIRGDVVRYRLAK